MQQIQWKASRLPDPTDVEFEQEIVPTQVDNATFAKFDSMSTKNALLDPRAYVKVRRANIKEFEDLREERRHSSSEDYIRSLDSTLRRMKEDTPPGPVFPSTEPEGLEAMVYYRLECLRLMREHPHFQRLAVNIDAVIAAYHTQELKYKPGHATMWWNGVMVEDLDPQELGNFDFGAGLARWKETHGEGIYWKEEILPPGIQL